MENHQGSIDNLTESGRLLLDMVTQLRERVTGLEAEVEGLRQKRRGLPILRPHEPGVCGVDPDSDSAECPHAGVYRHQKGCRGTACVEKTTAYYAIRRRSADVDD